MTTNPSTPTHCCDNALKRKKERCGCTPIPSVDTPPQDEAPKFCPVDGCPWFAAPHNHDPYVTARPTVTPPPTDRQKKIEAGAKDFAERFDDTATPYSKIDHSHCWTKDKPPCGQRIEHYKCCLCEELNPLVALAVKNREEEIVEKLQNWLEHDYRCSLKQFYEQFSAGRPTEDGGYEQKWDGKWYQSRPVDELPKPPKCDCGLDDSLSLLTQK